MADAWPLLSQIERAGVEEQLEEIRSQLQQRTRELQLQISESNSVIQVCCVQSVYVWFVCTHELTLEEGSTHTRIHD